MSIHNKIIVAGKISLTACAMLMLSACQYDFSLIGADNSVIGKGTLEISANFPSPAHALITGKEFIGTWRVSKVYEPRAARRHQLWHGHAVLIALDDAEMVCDFYYRSQPSSGNCSVDGESFRLSGNDSTQ